MSKHRDSTKVCSPDRMQPRSRCVAWMRTAYQRDPEAVARWKNESFPAIAAEAQVSEAEILFWNESGFLADAVYGKAGR
jgi:hypothetical protein